MRMQREEKEENRKRLLVPEMGRKKLLAYAESFRDLADTFSDMVLEENEEETADNREEIEKGEKFLLEKESLIWQKRLSENRAMVSSHLKEAADILTEVTEETYHCLDMNEKSYKKLYRMLKEANVLLDQITLYRNEKGFIEITMSLQQYKNSGFTANDVANALSVVMDKRMVCGKDCPFFPTNEKKEFHFVEEPRFHYLAGVAKAVKENEKISGDTYSIEELDTGILTVILSDGMGSGEKACSDSENVIELLEKFLGTGYSLDTAVKMINGSLITGRNEQNMSTLDLCQLNLYTGKLECMKVGAAPSFLKRDYLVEQITARTLPLGIFYDIRPEIMERTFQDGDLIILLSDGIQDGFS
ncbi:MAG: SpoIIE family protein phosphatase [Lachnospiraceae bacterium]|nr:SpoIIE family protein phosphatase [Lachnospiraceae bacterium]